MSGVDTRSTAVEEPLAFFFCARHGSAHREAPGRGLPRVERSNVGQIAFERSGVQTAAGNALVADLNVPAIMVSSLPMKLLTAS